MKENKKWAIICWVLSVLVFLATLLLYEGTLTKNMILDFAMAILWALVGFIHWKRKDKKTE